ncbi:DUF6527 family protein [uncultured Nostoc sp.]|uniref:DUF6527 family protein n=1 Tax=uncultured Nostoc sp. TaxID=340711 RepID=UPI0035CA2C7A
MSKLLPIEDNGQIVGYLFDCPGCGNCHAPYIRPFKNEVGASWTFNGDLEKPTFQPSILATVERTDGKTMVCHSFVIDGRIQFLSDCTHALAGQTVDVPEQN